MRVGGNFLRLYAIKLQLVHEISQNFVTAY